MEGEGRRAGLLLLHGTACQGHLLEGSHFELFAAHRNSEDMIKKVPGGTHAIEYRLYSTLLVLASDVQQTIRSNRPAPDKNVIPANMLQELQG